MARDPPGPARLRAAVGLGRDELHRHQGSGRRRLSARQDDRRVVVGCRARRDAGRRPGHRLQGADAAARAGKFEVHADLEKYVFSKGKSAAKEDFAQVLYNRGLINSMLGVEAIRTAQEKFGKKPLTGEQVRWGFENLEPDRRPHQGAGLRGHAEADQVLLRRPPGRRPGPRPAVGRQGVEDHLRLVHGRPGDRSSRWSRSRPAKYAAEKKITPRDCSKES